MDTQGGYAGGLGQLPIRTRLFAGISVEGISTSKVPMRPAAVFPAHRGLHRQADRHETARILSE
jgi:hypothetical protein